MNLGVFLPLVFGKSFDNDLVFFQCFVKYSSEAVWSWLF